MLNLGQNDTNMLRYHETISQMSVIITFFIQTRVSILPIHLSFQSRFFTFYANWILAFTSSKESTVHKSSTTFLDVMSAVKSKIFRVRMDMRDTHLTTKASIVPLPTQSLYHHICDWLSTTSTLSTEAFTMAIYTPGKPIFLHKWCIRVKRISAFSTEEMAHVPLPTTCYYHFAFDGGLARPAPRTEILMEV